MRKLRISGNTAMVETAEPEVTVERRLRPSLPDEIIEKVDRYRKVSSELKEKERIFKAETKNLQTEEAALKRELLLYGKQNDLESLTTDTTLLEYTTRVQRTIDPKQFLKFLQSIGNTKLFYDYCNVPITNAISNFGEAVLTASDVLQSSVNQYAGLKVQAK